MSGIHELVRTIRILQEKDWKGASGEEARDGVAKHIHTLGSQLESVKNPNINKMIEIDKHVHQIENILKGL